MFTFWAEPFCSSILHKPAGLHVSLCLQDGTVRVPRALQPYLGLEVIEKPKYKPLKYIGTNQPSRPPRPAPKTR